MKEMKKIEDSYPTSAMQERLLLYSLLEQEIGIYIEQIICTLPENLNISAFIQSWQRVLERHPVLRTSFHWEASNQLTQILHDPPNPPYQGGNKRWKFPSPFNKEGHTEVNKDSGARCDIKSV